MTLPKSLNDAVREGRAFLFLGAGATVGAKHPKTTKQIMGQDLADKLAEKFLGSEFIGHPLQQVSEIAISEHDLFSVQQYIAGLFYDYTPSDFHMLIPKFRWGGIATTNYDLIIERAYDSTKNALQHLVVFKKDGEHVEERLKNPDSVMYLKLHGCITDINDTEIPLILTPDQYITHKKFRTRLFEKVHNFACEYPFIFVGHSLSDIDIRAMLNELSVMGDARPRSYIVTPNMTQAEARFWENKKITHIQMDFKNFLSELDSNIPAEFRKLSKLFSETNPPIYKRFKTSDVGISDSLSTFLTRDVDYVHREIRTEQPEPNLFYKGYFDDWSPIASNLDVKRKFTDSIMSEVVLENEEARRDVCEFIVIKGHAGAGKSVILKRLAWDASIHYEKLCLFVKESSCINFESISELYRLCGERIFLFFDPITEFSDVIEEIIPKAQKENIPITIVGAERHNEWNTDCNQLDVYVNRKYDVPYLNEKEIEGLIHLLSQHKSLGYLQDKSFEEQKEALGKKAGRQILVALHEATLGKPLSDIVFDEYISISPRRAQSLYLTICIFNRVRVPVRAGFISRVHGITFTEFSEKLFKPLENIVFAKKNEHISDYEYRTRHSHIADIVFERVLNNVQDRYDEYSRIINAIDVDFNSDREAFKSIMNFRGLIDLFPDPQMIRELFSKAYERDDKNPMLIQQEALFEMHSTNGNLEKASNLLLKAHKLAPYSKSIAHSLSELALKRADKSSTELEKKKYFQESKDLALEQISKGTYTAHPYHTLIKIGMRELEDLIAQNDNDNSERKIKEVEKTISRVIQLFPDDDYIREIEAQFNTLLHNNAKALTALQHAFSINKRSSYIASRLAKIFESNGQINESIKVLQDCLEINPSEKHINYQLAMLLINYRQGNNDDVIFHLRRSFTIGDNNYSAQFWYARYMYLFGEQNDAMELFKQLGSLNIDNRIKQEPRGTVVENGTNKIFLGTVSTLETSYSFITRDSYQDSIFTYVNYNDKDEWENLRYHMRVKFNLAFNFKGPVALNVAKE